MNIYTDGTTYRACPLCGSPAQNSITTKNGGLRFKAECSLKSCDMRARTSWYASQRTARDEWNRKVAEELEHRK